MKFRLYLFSIKSFFELLIIIIFAFIIFCSSFGGIPTGEWIALNIFPLISGILSWLTTKVIFYYVLIKNRMVFYYLLLFIVSLFFCNLFLYVFKKI